MTNHKHLRNVIEDIYSNGNQLTEELTLMNSDILIYIFRPKGQTEPLTSSSMRMRTARSHRFSLIWMSFTSSSRMRTSR